MVRSKQNIRNQMYEIIFHTDTKIGKLFDVFLIILIFISIISVILESVKSIQQEIGTLLKVIEWVITILFTIEYLVRIWVVKHPFKFMTSPFGIIDLLSCLPTYLSFIVLNGGSFILIRSLRLLRLFRVLKLSRYIDASSVLWQALKASRYKISIFIYVVLIIVVMVGALMYLVEGPTNGFDSIPRSMYWVIVTITTVGFGDITPSTTIGQIIASFIMILGYGIIVIPSSIVTVEYSRIKKVEESDNISNCCQNCFSDIQDIDAIYCKYCGAKLEDEDN